MKFDGERLQRLRGGFPRFRAVLAEDGVFDLGVANLGHMDGLVRLRGFVEQFLDGHAVRLTTEVGDEREAVENLSGHGAPPVPSPASYARPIPRRAACRRACV